ncbi:hypothetical protein [uncultured Enterococcus sp.]|uniref:hypothetical protein n=1 Tax=uncultured Enterococcus sp. TaxID=167972 RepID=UPI002AA894B1|nr:hypothetical protein [uncultured Enterococcus sp.]
MNKRGATGIADKIRLVSAFPEMLVRFTLHTRNEDINCFIARRDLANLIMFLDDNIYELSVFGHYNSRNQLIIEKFAVRNPNSFIQEFVSKPLKAIGV